MYHSTENRQICFDDFFQPAGLHMNPNNRWIRLADMIPWSKYEKSIPVFSRMIRRLETSPSLSEWRWAH